jgi:uncharacterized protein YukE
LTNPRTGAAKSVRRHADRIDELRFRLEEVRFSSTLMARDAGADGSVFAWINDDLERTVQRQDGIVEYLAENLEIAARRLRATANAFDGRPGAPALAKVDAAAYWAPKGLNAPRVDFGAKPLLAAKIQGLRRTISVQSWAAGDLAERGAASSPEFDNAMIDSALPLRDIKTALLYRPEIIAAQVAAWNGMSAELHRIAQELQELLEHDMPEWTGEAHAAYCWLMDHNVNAATALSATAAGLAAAVEGVGVVITATSARVLERTAELASHLEAWAAGDTAGQAATAPPLQLVAAVAKWAVTVASSLAALALSLANLKERLPNPKE